jgi:transposase
VQQKEFPISMSTSPYDQDLREKAMAYVQQGHSQAKTARIFGIHRNTLNRWCLRYQEEGHFQARKRLGLKSKVDPQELEKFVLSHPHCQLSDVGERFGITTSHARRLLRQNDFRYKKKLFNIKKSVKRNEKFTGSR